MPFYLSLSTFLMSASFLVYGSLNNDPFVYVISIASFIFLKLLLDCTKFALMHSNNMDPPSMMHPCIWEYIQFLDIHYLND